MSDVVLGVNHHQSELNGLQGTCVLRFDNNLLQCFHVYCTNCCNQLTVRQEEQGEGTVTLHCTTCQSLEAYPPKPKVCEAEDADDATHCEKLSVFEFGQEHDGEEQELSCELFSVMNKQKTLCSVRKTGLNLYEVTCKPRIRGVHRLCVTIDGQHVRGSPFSVVTRVPIETIGSPMMILQPLKRPWGVAVKPSGEIVVVEHDDHCVTMCSTGGRKGRFGTSTRFPCTTSLTFEDPRGLAIDHHGNLLVVDGKECCVQKFTSDGRLIAKVGQKGRKRLEFHSPVGIAIHPLSRKVYVADNGNHRIQVLHPDFTFSHAFGKYGNGDGELQFPWDVAFDSAGNAYIVDSWNNRVQVFTEEGEYLRQIGQKGRNAGELFWPASICIDIEDIVYVAEAQNHRVSVFTTQGEFLTSFGEKGTSRYAEFTEPTGITVDRYRVVYVSDSGNNRLMLF